MCDARPMVTVSYDHCPLAGSKLHCLPLDDRGTGVNNLPRVIRSKWNGRDANPRPLDCKFNDLTHYTNTMSTVSTHFAYHQHKFAYIITCNCNVAM